MSFKIEQLYDNPAISNLQRTRDRLDQLFVDHSLLIYHPPDEYLPIMERGRGAASIPLVPITAEEISRLRKDPTWIQEILDIDSEHTGIKIVDDPDYGRVFKSSSDELHKAWGTIAKIRLIYAYLFLSEILPKKDWLLDVGTYDGFGPKLEKRIANRIVTIDDDFEAQKNARPTLMIYPGIYPVSMRAQDMNFKKKFDYVAVIEILTGGFHGSQEDLERLIQNAYDSLKPGGVFVFTLPSMLGDKFESFSKANIPDKQTETKFHPYREQVTPILEKVFGPNKGIYYGQFPAYANSEGEGITYPISSWREKGDRGRAVVSITSESLIPRQIGSHDLAAINYGHYLGVWTK